MWSFKRKSKSDAVVPSEAMPAGLKAAQHQPMWLVWLLSIGTFFGTIAVVLLLFFAGRWTWNHFHNSEKTPIAPTGSTTISQPRATEQPQTTSPTPSQSQQDSAPTNNPAVDVPSVSTPSTTAPSTTVPATTSQPKLINTGPDGDY